MAETTPTLEAKSPYELRVDLAKNVPETDVRSAVASGDVGFLHSFTTGSAVDGPGIRIVAWTAGCMWRCLYCHNPDTWTMTNGMPVTIKRATEVMSQLRHGLKIMSGGVTLSGGEPLMQHRFAVKLLTAARTLGIHTTIETNGYFSSKITDAEVGAIDLVMLGMKTWDPERHKKLTGMDNAPTIEFARRLAALNRPIWFRFVLVPGLTDDLEDIRHIASFGASLGNVQRVDVLPFHQMGRYKWERLGLTYTLNDVKPPSEELIQKVVGIFRAEGLKAD